MAQTLINLGHTAYNGANAARVCFSKAQAVRVLRNRGMKRDEARRAINNVVTAAAEHYTRSNYSSIALSEFSSVECTVCIDQTPYGWPSFDTLRARWKNSPEL